MFNGYKTIFGSIGGMCSGIALIAKAVSSGDYSHIGEGLTLFFGGLTALGIRHKLARTAEEK